MTEGRTEAAPRLAHVVILPSPAGLPDVLTYRVPEALAAKVRVGVPVLAPLSGRRQLGYVIGVGEGGAPLSEDRLRDLEDVPAEESDFDEAMVRLVEWVARRYYCGLSDALALAAPERHALVMRTFIQLGEWNGEICGRAGPLMRRSLAAVHAALTAAGGILDRDELEKRLGDPNLSAALRRARQEGWVREVRSLGPPQVRPMLRAAVRMAPGWEDHLAGRFTERQRRVLARVALPGGAAVSKRRLREQADVGDHVIARLVRRGVLERTTIRVRRTPRIADFGHVCQESPTRRQEAAVREVAAASREGSGRTQLLFGVTGSGKTEVYLRAIEEVRGRGRSCLLLVPEISLTAQVAAAVRARLGEGVAVMHSGLADGERLDEWHRARSGEADVVVGPRSALFAPVREPGLIILDEEHDGSYKQSNSPRYHARETARERARLCGGSVLLGSATPSIESFHAALCGDYDLLELPDRVHGRPLPAVEVVDLRKEQRSTATGVLGRRLEEAVDAALARKEQVILFLNRRGYNAFLLCRECGHVPQCPSCAVSLTLHQERVGLLRCHHCDHVRRAPTLCEKCLGSRVKRFGIGTQRVEDAVRERFPRARVARLDRDVMGRKGAHEQVIAGVVKGEIDILVGTQMVAKGFDFPGVTLVGVVSADVALNMPDFRAAERAFQLLTQVSGRTGRGDLPGRVIVQTFKPDHPSIRAASRHDYRGFFEQEIVQREETGYPPFGSLARVIAALPEDRDAEEHIGAAARLLRGPASRHNVEVRGPAPCPLARLRERWRRHLLLRGPTPESLHAVLEETAGEIRRRLGDVVIDVDPVDLL